MFQARERSKSRGFARGGGRWLKDEGGCGILKIGWIPGDSMQISGQLCSSSQSVNL